MAPVAIPVELTRAISLDRWETLLSAFGRPAGLESPLSHDAIDRALALTSSVPSRLRRPLARLVTLGDETGREALLDACVDAGVDVARLPADETPAELAVRALVAAEVEPEGPFAGIVDRALAHAFRLGAEESRAYEYLAATPRVFRTAPSRQRLDVLSRMVAAWCFSHGRRRHADVRVCEEGDAIHLVVRRSRRAEPRVVLEADGTVSARVDHPMTTDQLAIPHDGSRLSIWTSAPRMVRLYCRAVGRALFEDERYFDGPPAYSLSVLAERGREALSVAGFAAELAEVRVIDLEWDSGVRETARLSGQDVMEAIERERIRLAGRNIGMAKLRFTRAGSGRKTSVTIWPASRVRLPRGEDEKLVRAFLQAAGIARPRPTPPTLLSLPPFIHPERTWRAVLGARVSSLIEERGLVPFQSRAVAHPEYPHEGRSLITLPVGQADDLYGVSMAPHVPSRRLDRAELAMLRLDLAALGRELSRELGLSGAASVVDGFDVVDLGARRLGRTTTRFFLVAAHPGHEAARLGVLLHGRSPDARPVALVPGGPGGVRLGLGIPEVPIADLSAELTHVLSDVVRALGLTAEIPAVLLAPPGARLVLDAGSRLAWLDGVPLSRLTERQMALLLLLAMRGEAVSGKEADEAVSPHRRIDGAAREAKRDLGAAVAQSFAAVGSRTPTEELIVRDGRKGYRLGVPVFVAAGELASRGYCLHGPVPLPPRGSPPASTGQFRCLHGAVHLPPQGSPPASTGQSTCLGRHPAHPQVAVHLPREAPCLPPGGSPPASRGSRPGPRRPQPRGITRPGLPARPLRGPYVARPPRRGPLDATLTPRNSSGRRCRLSSVDGDAEGPGHGGAGADVVGDDQEDRPIKNITKKSQALETTSMFPAASVARWSTQLETLTKEIGTHAVPRAIPTGVARSRVGGDHVITVVLEACERHGITLPGQLSPERLRANADETRRLRGLRTQLETLKRLVDASLAEADGTSWEGATTAYSMLRRLGDTDPALADSLAPAVAFFTPTVKKTKAKSPEEKKMPALAPATNSHST